MNYQGNEQLRADVSAMASDFYELRQRLHELESKYFYGSTELSERLAGQLIRQMNEKVLALYMQANEMDYAFRD